MTQVSIILPTYNRAQWLADACSSIWNQTFSDWELIIVDDGSTDDTRQIVQTLAAKSPQPMRYVHQTNGGSGSARAKGLSMVNSRYVAWLDSDDLWKPHHLMDCVTALEANDDVDWIFCAFERIEMQSGKTITPMSFRENDKPKDFLKLHTRDVGALHVIEDPNALRFCLSGGQFGYFGASVFRASLFEKVSCSDVRVQEDSIMLIQAVALGFKPAYLDQVNATVREHDDHACARNTPVSIEKHIQIKRESIRAFQTLEKFLPAVAPQQTHLLNKHLAEQIFWGLGYSLLWQNGFRAQAMQAFEEGLKYAPSDRKMKKFRFKARIRSLFGLAPKPTHVHQGSDKS